MYSKDTHQSGVGKYERYYNDDDRGNAYAERVCKEMASVILFIYY